MLTKIYVTKECMSSVYFDVPGSCTGRETKQQPS